MQGTIVKGIAGFYYVDTEEGVYQCKARGIFRKDGIVPRVGDNVIIEIIDEGEAVINEILARKNEFIRPPIANVDCLVIVIAAKQPDPNIFILDKFLVMAELHHTDVVICVNKIDLVEREQLKLFKEIYQPIYPLVFVSGKTGEGIKDLENLIKNKKSALAGPSGVGKSTLLNWIEGKAIAETGEVSEKTKRGKNTTRHVELYSLKIGGMIFDTPGFTSFDVLEAEEDELSHLYPEMLPYLSKCRYDDCRHIAEPDCGVQKAVKEGKIHESRYDSYVNQMKEIREKRKY
ncbi:MAG: ribosome small subunit-dependent GTPase A [Clostridiales bacterium]|jgi:ribosome biogenesis GTPase|nr:ribosome small subunit-dependent GTPase A [Clostridiales bacterium]